MHLISIMSFKLGHVSIPKRRIFLPLFLLCAYDSSVLQNFKIFTHLLTNFSYKDPRLTEVTYHCINFNDRVKKVPKMYYLNVWNFSDPIVEVNAVVRHFRHPWVPLVEQDLLALPGYLSYPRYLVGFVLLDL